MSNQIQPIPLVTGYFGLLSYDPDPVLITQEFIPGKGWRRSNFRKRVSRSWLRKLKEEGVTHVALTYQNRTADFTVAELLKRERTPLFRGNLIGAAVKLS